MSANGRSLTVDPEERRSEVRSAPNRLGDCEESSKAIPEVLRKQGSASNCCSTADNVCPCNTLEAVEQISKEIQFCNRKTWVSMDRMNELRKKAQEAVKVHKTFTIRGCFFSVRNALTARGWVEKLDVHRKHVPSGVCQVTYEDLAQGLPKRKPGETRRQYLIKCERNIMSRFLEHMPIDFLWTARKEKCDYIDQAKNPTLIINKFHRVPFTSKEGLCNQLKDFHWFYEEGTSEMYFPRCYNVWSPEELTDFVDNFKLTACMSFLRWLVDKFKEGGFDAVFCSVGKIPFTAIEFAFKRCNEFIDSCNHNDIDVEETIRIWEHDWDAFLTQHYILTAEGAKICSDPNRLVDPIIKTAEKILDTIRPFWTQYGLDGYLNLWIVKPANKCRGRGIHLMDNLKKILNSVNPAIASKSRFVVQKYIALMLIPSPVPQDVIFGDSIPEGLFYCGKSAIQETTDPKSILLKPSEILALGGQLEPLTPPNRHFAKYSVFPVDKVKELRKKAEEAVRLRKVFTTRGGSAAIRKSLTARGWVELLSEHRRSKNAQKFTYCELLESLPRQRPAETKRQYVLRCERYIMSRYMQNPRIEFVWTSLRASVDFLEQERHPSMVVNKIFRVPFTSKHGLCSALKSSHWFYEEGVSDTLFPRCYNVWLPEDMMDFLADFKITSCVSFLKFILDESELFAADGEIPLSSIEFAIHRCAEFLNDKLHKHIDSGHEVRLKDNDWEEFFHQHTSLTKENGRILTDCSFVVDILMERVRKTLSDVRCYLPQSQLDGFLNLWIVKPANKCRGRGIHLTGSLKRIMSLCSKDLAPKRRFVVQKYIERPLIIHNTKFDIRQWFLVTSTQPLMVWMYKECYLRFSSQEYNLSSHHESVHLTNHAIQKKYRNGKRDKRLPSENMWDSYSFQAYLRQIGMHDMWTGRIYPGMQRAIVGTMLASQDNMDRRTNTFELFGADFMISEDFYPWLIEINSSPDLGATTSVTARMCPQCLEDVIKVVIDRKNDPKAETGNFELIYRQTIPPTPAYMGLNLSLKGKQIITKSNQNNRRDRSTSITTNPFKYSTHTHFHGTTITVAPASSNLTPMPTFHATEFLEKYSPSRHLALKTASLSPSSLSSNFSNSTRHLLTPLSNNSPSPRYQLLQTPIRRRSNEILWKSKSPRGEQMNAQSTSRRHLSCGPRLVVSEKEASKKQSASVNNTNKLLPKTPPNSANLPNRKHIMELICKSKSNRKTSGKGSKKLKASPMNPNVLSSTGSRRNYLNSVKKLANFDKSFVRHGKTCKGFASGKGKGAKAQENGSPFHAVGKSLNPPKAREFRLWKDSDGPITTHTIIGCKSSVSGLMEDLSHREISERKLSDVGRKLAARAQRENTRC